MNCLPKVSTHVRAAEALMRLKNIEPQLLNCDGETAEDIALNALNFDIYDLIHPGPGFVSPLPTIQEAAGRAIVTKR